MQENRPSPKQYSLWLDNQIEDQIWKEINATLDDYDLVERGKRVQSSYYPLMVQIGLSLTQENL